MVCFYTFRSNIQKTYSQRVKSYLFLDFLKRSKRDLRINCLFILLFSQKEIEYIF